MLFFLKILLNTVWHTRLQMAAPSCCRHPLSTCHNMHALMWRKTGINPCPLYSVTWCSCMMNNYHWTLLYNHKKYRSWLMNHGYMTGVQLWLCIIVLRPSKINSLSNQVMLNLTETVIHHLLPSLLHSAEQHIFLLIRKWQKICWLPPAQTSVQTRDILVTNM